MRTASHQTNSFSFIRCNVFLWLTPCILLVFTNICNHFAWNNILWNSQTIPAGHLGVKSLQHHFWEEWNNVMWPSPPWITNTGAPEALQDNTEPPPLLNDVFFTDIPINLPPILHTVRTTTYQAKDRKNSSNTWTGFIFLFCSLNAV